VKYQIVARKVRVKGRRLDRWLVRQIGDNGRQLAGSELLNSADAAETNLLAIARGHSPTDEAHLSLASGCVYLGQRGPDHSVEVEWVDERSRK
jgi:hypothetical protein